MSPTAHTNLGFRGTQLAAEQQAIGKLCGQQRGATCLDSGMKSRKCAFWARFASACRRSSTPQSDGSMRWIGSLDDSQTRPDRDL
jgi:hypothetical protein